MFHYCVEIKIREKYERIKILKPLPLLYVDDDVVLMESTKQTLALFFDDITTANNGKEALELVSKKKFSIVILDIMMPYVNGLEVAKEIRKNDKDILIFITSSHQETSSLREALKLNMVDYLIKPFSFSTLLETLRECVLRLQESGKLMTHLSHDIYYDSIKKCAIRESQEIKLSKNEVKLLELLLEKKGGYTTVEEIEYAVFFDSDECKYGAIKNLISRLNKKIGERAILNTYELGYQLG